MLQVIVPADDLSRQALAAQAEDLAVEDCLLVLEKAMLQGKLQPDMYMKQVGGQGNPGHVNRVGMPAVVFI